MLIREQRLGFMPLSFLHYAIWYLFLGYHALAFGFAVAGHPFEASTFMHAIDTAVVVWLAPNVLRVFCLHFVSSNMHYYGDVESGNIVQQCQEIGRVSCRERECQYVYISVVAVTLKNNNKQ